MPGTGDNDHRLGVDRDLLERRFRDRLGNERRIELAGEHMCAQGLRVAGAQLERDLGKTPQIFVHRRALSGSQPQQPTRPGIVHRLTCFLGKIEQAIRVVEQQPACRREMHPFALADKELDAELRLELAHARGHVGLHAVKLFRGAGDASGLDDGAEDMQVGQIHVLNRRWITSLLFILRDIGTRVKGPDP